MTSGIWIDKNRTITRSSTAITIEYPLPKRHPANNLNSRDSNYDDPEGRIVILTIDDVSWFKRTDREWRTTTAKQPFFDIGDIQTNHGIVVGNIGDTVYRHGHVELFLKVVQSRGWMMIVERLRSYHRQAERNKIIQSTKDAVEMVSGDLRGGRASEPTTVMPDESLLSESLTNSNVSGEERIVTPSPSSSSDPDSITKEPVCLLLN